MASAQPHTRHAHRARRLSAAALVLAVIGALVLASAGLGYRLGLWSLAAGFAVLRASVYVAALILIIALIGAVLALSARAWAGFAAALLALLVAVGTAAVPLDMRRTAASVPAIHDITTDTETPPEFVALRPQRERAPNGVAYAGAAVAAEQKKAYPDIGPVLLATPPPRAFARAEAAARSLGWQIVAAVPAEGRIEASDTTRWWGFTDDVVIRVAPALDGSRVDIRSESRVGRSDLGVNARRIRAFLAALRAGGEK